MFSTPLFLLFLFSALFNFSSVATQQLQQQCDCDGVTPGGGTDVPVFTAFKDNNQLDPSIVPQYALHLQEGGIYGVTLLAPQAGSLYLTLAQKKQVIKTWCDVRKSTGFPYTMKCHVGEADYNDTLDLARYAKRSCCDIVVAGPPIYYPPRDIAGLVDYLKGIADACYPTPFMYADVLLFPECNFVYNTAKLFGQLAKVVENFIGVKSNYETCKDVQASNDVSTKIVESEASQCIAESYLSCLNGTSTLLANVFPKMVVDIQQASLRGDIDEAFRIQCKIYSLYLRVLDLRNSPERFDRSQLAIVIQYGRLFFEIVTGIDLGVLPSPPLPKLSRKDVMRVYQVCKEEGYATMNPYDNDYYNNNQKSSGKNNKNKYQQNNNDENSGWDK